MAPRPFTITEKENARGTPAPEGWSYSPLPPTYTTFVTVIPNTIVINAKRQSEFDDGIVVASTLAADPEFPSRAPKSTSRSSPAAQAQTSLATAAIAAGFAVGALVVIAGACYLVYCIRRNRRTRHPRWNMVGPTISTSNISAPMPLYSAGPYSHLSEMSFPPRAPPARKPVPKFVIGDDEEKTDDTASTDSHATVRVMKTVVQETHRSMRPAPPRPRRPDSVTTPEGATPTQEYFTGQPLRVTNADNVSVAPPATKMPAPKQQPLQSAPAASSVYNGGPTILDEPSPFIQTAPIMPAATNPFADPLPPVPFGMAPVPAALNPVPARFSSNNPFNRFSMAGTLTAVSTRSGFFPNDLPYEDRSPPSLPASAIGSTETPTRPLPPIPHPLTSQQLDQFPMPPSRHSEYSNSSTGSGRSRASRPVVPLRISTFPYAMPQVQVLGPTTASTVVGPASAISSTRASSPVESRPTVIPPELPRLVIEPPTGVAQRTSELLQAMGLSEHTTAFRSAGLIMLNDLQFRSSEGLRAIDPELTAEDAESLVVAVDDALRSASKGKAPRAPF
ncbi:hypothetical protein EXIGLDRAFT_734907 [Exidia glandulosa HHB12029]|uniref:SAM domain-containing protein n=1 Tax=Exidia glandulosa HHB12029 TaxID=1314781 RepID=A0A165K2N2_EXIGL|nr:hypothetical protein EXIGLDRAFT_734907 [Exidia glandulosa HHB12029]